MEKKQIFESGNHIRIFQFNANIQMSKYSLTSLKISDFVQLTKYHIHVVTFFIDTISVIR